MFSRSASVFYLLFAWMTMASSAVEVALPHVDLFMVCQLPSKTTLNETDVSDELKEYFMSFNASSVSFSSFNTTIDRCVANDVVEVETNLDGTLELDDDTTLDAAALKDLVNEDDIKDYLDPLCENLLLFASNIDDAGAAAKKDGWTKRLSNAFCDLDSSKLDLSMWTIIGIVIGGLALICFLVCCCCGGRKK